jgi:hypothetical protein
MDDPTLWYQVWHGALEYLLPACAVLLTALASWGLKRLATKLGLQVDLTQEAAIRQAVRAAIGAAEEMAAKKLKLEDKGPDMDKLGWVITTLDKQWPKLAPEDLERMIHEEIASMSGVGATGDKVIS